MRNKLVLLSVWLAKLSVEEVIVTSILKLIY